MEKYAKRHVSFAWIDHAMWLFWTVVTYAAVWIVHDKSTTVLFVGDRFTGLFQLTAVSVLQQYFLVLGIKEASLFISAIQMTCECSQNK